MNKINRLNGILNALYCPSIGEIALESGFKSRQALHQWLSRNGYKLAVRYELVQAQKKRYPKKSTE